MLPPKILTVGLAVSFDVFIFLCSNMEIIQSVLFLLYEILRMLTFISLLSVIISDALPSFLLLTPLQLLACINNFIEDGGKICI